MKKKKKNFSSLFVNNTVCAVNFLVFEEMLDLFFSPKVENLFLSDNVGVLQCI